MKIVSLNTLLSIPFPIRMNNQRSRLERIPEALRRQIGDDIDVLLLQEVMHPYKNSLLKRLKRMFAHVTKGRSIKNNLLSNNLRFIDSGLVTLSCHEIVHQYLHTFRSYGVGWEQLVGKGVLYTCLKVFDEQYIHVFNVHLQAFTSSECRKIRDKQIQEIVALMKRLCINTEKDAIVIGGDFNIDMYENCNEIESIENALNMSLSRPKDTIFTFNSHENSLVGLDDPQEYRTKADVNGCLSSYLASNKCICCPRQLVDMFFVSKALDKYTVTSMELRSMNTMIVYTSFTSSIQSNNLSDHAALILNVEMDKSQYSKYPSQSYMTSNNQVSIVWTIVLLCVFGVLMTTSLVLFFKFNESRKKRYT